MDEIPPLPAEISDEEHKRLLAPRFIKFADRRLQDPIAAAKADRLAELRQDDKPISIAELEAARNRLVRQGIRRIHEMKPQEIIGFVEVLDGEIASMKVTNSDAPGVTKATRDEMLKKMQGSKQSNGSKSEAS